jgi:membrane protein implicated in regulation of membrane protease activity
MLPFYIVAAIVGGGLVLVTLVTGHGDHDADIGHHDHDFDHEAGHGDVWLPFLSLRFWTYFLMVAGLTGILLTQFTDSIEPMTAVWSAVSGLSVGLVVSLLMRWAKNMQTDDATRTQDFLGREATVIVPIRPNLEGKVRLEVKGEIIELLALPYEDREITREENVVIVALENDRARVMPRDELLENQNHA